MKQVVNKAGKINIEDVPPPTIREGYVLVSNRFSLISTGTEISNIKNSSESILSKAIKNKDLFEKGIDKIKTDGIKPTIDFIKQQTNKLGILGYSSAGIVIDKGKNVDNVTVKDHVACGGGGYAYHAEIIAVPKNLVVKLPKGVAFDEAAFTTLGSIALQGVRRAKVQIGDVVVVIGLGLVGQLTTQILRTAGCRVIGYDLNEDRVKLAKELGLHVGISSYENPVKSVFKYTGGVGADAIIICAATSSNKPVNQAMEMARKKGIIVVVGKVGLHLKRSELYKKELDFFISTSYGPGRYDPLYEEKGIDYPIGYVRWTENRNMKAFLEMVSENKVNIKPLISHKFHISDAIKAYKTIHSDENSLGILLKYNEKENEKIEKKVIVSTGKQSGKINVAVVGCGSFAQNYHLPNLRKISDYNIRAVVSATGTTVKEIAKKFGAEYCTTDFEDILRDKNIDTVFITTRHNLHAPLSIAAAKAKKNIFLEKPLALNYNDCKKVVKAVEENNVLFSIGFNRRFSPVSLKAKQFIGKGTGPLMLNYIVNANKLPPEHWVHDPIEGGGRMIGESCHFFDLIYWFVGNEPIEIFSRGLSSSRIDLTEDENNISTIKFADGSIASLTYTSVGHKSYPKERVEIYFNENVLLIDNFKNLRIWGNQKNFIKLKKMDKGHYAELVRFAKVIKGKDHLLVTAKDGIRATLCSLKALESLRSGKVVHF